MECVSGKSVTTAEKLDRFEVAHCDVMATIA